MSSRDAMLLKNLKASSWLADAEDGDGRSDAEHDACRGGDELDSAIQPGKQGMD